MSAPNLDIADVEQRTIATERLLGALIAVLTTRDAGLLRELQGMFDSEEFAGDQAGRAAAETWRRIASELRQAGVIADTLSSEGSEH